MKQKYARKQQKKKNRDVLKPLNSDTKAAKNQPAVKRVQIPRRTLKSR